MSWIESIEVVEDDKYITEFLTATLRNHGYKVLTAASGAEAMFVFSSHRPSLVLLDLGLPDEDGMEVLRHMRELADSPIIVVSARHHEQEKISALDAGAVDYLCKPFYMGELLARIRVVERIRTRLTSPEDSQVYTCDWLKVDLDKRRVWRDEREVHLTPLEYKLLTVFISYRGRVLTYSQIIRELWGPGGGEPENVRAFTSSLRRKLERDMSDPRFIITEVGVGYRWNDDQ